MRYVIIAIMFLSTNLYCQITGNNAVNDIKAIRLDSLNKEKLAGQWKTVRAVEFIKNDNKELKIQFWRIYFNKNTSFLAKRCEDCLTENEGEWRVDGDKVLNITTTNNSKRGTYELEGSWSVYKLTDTELILVKVLTSSGDWKKFWYFEKVQ